jgi:hypothetical protein
MSSHIPYLDGNVSAGELSKVFAADITAAVGQCGNCDATQRFAEARVYMDGPGIVARCCVCEHILLRFVSVRHGVLLDVRGLSYLRFDTTN